MDSLFKYKLDYHLDISVAIVKFMVFDSLLNPKPKLKVGLDNTKILTTWFKSLSDDLAKIKINQNSTYNMVHNLKDVVSWC